MSSLLEAWPTSPPTARPRWTPARPPSWSVTP